MPAARSTPSPLIGSSKLRRMDGQATPSTLSGRPRLTKARMAMTGRLRPVPGVIGLLDTRAPARGAPGAGPGAEPLEGSTRAPARGCRSGRGDARPRRHPGARRARQPARQVADEVVDLPLEPAHAAGAGQGRLGALVEAFHDEAV